MHRKVYKTDVQLTNYHQVTTCVTSTCVGKEDPTAPKSSPKATRQPNPCLPLQRSGCPNLILQRCFFPGSANGAMQLATFFCLIYFH